MKAEERAKPLFVSEYWNGANFQATVNAIRAAETEAHNKAVEACVQAVINLGLRSDGAPRGQDIVLGAIRRLKREPDYINARSTVGDNPNEPIEGNELDNIIHSRGPERINKHDNDSEAN